MLNEILKQKADLEKLGKRFNNKISFNSDSCLRLDIERINDFYFLKFGLDIFDPFLDNKVYLRDGWENAINEDAYILVKKLAKELELKIGHDKLTVWIEK